MCSTIVAEVLIDRVRDGNVSINLAIDTGKKLKKSGHPCRRQRGSQRRDRIYSVLICEDVPKKVQKKSGVELLSRTLVCSTIVAEVLIDRVRDGNVSINLAIDTGKRS